MVSQPLFGPGLKIVFHLVDDPPRAVAERFGTENRAVSSVSGARLWRLSRHGTVFDA